MDERLPWERQKGESRKAFEAFVAYRDAGPNRSYRDVAQRLHKSLTIIGRWGRRWAWTERVDAWDAHLDRLSWQEQEKARKDMLDRHARTAIAIQSKVLERLREFREKDLSAKDLIRWFDVAVKVERLARGEPTENMEVRGQMRLHQSGVAYELATDPELAREIQGLLIARLGGADPPSPAGCVGGGHGGRAAVGEAEGDPAGAGGPKKGGSRKRKRDG